MNDTTKIALAAAVAGGYVLGRAKKGRMAFAAATYLAGRRFGLDPRQLATEGLRKLADTPQVAELNEQVRGELLSAGRKAVAAAADRQLANLAGTLRDRTKNIGAKKQEEPPDEDEEEYGPEEDEEEPEEPADYEEEDAEEDEAEEDEAEDTGDDQDDEAGDDRDETEDREPEDEQGEDEEPP
ncbi:histone protein, partial [Kitasatospora sp. NPDC058263]